MNLKTSIKDNPEDIVSKVAPPYTLIASFYDPNIGWKIATDYMIITCFEKEQKVILQYPDSDKTQQQAQKVKI